MKADERTGRHTAGTRRFIGLALGLVGPWFPAGLGLAGDTQFHLPADPGYSIVDSAVDSARFTLERTLRADERGHLVSISSFVDPEGEVMGWHDFGHLEGPGWAANAAGGAWELLVFGRWLGEASWESSAVRVLDHVLEGGFLDDSGLIRGYRETTTGKFCLNYKHNSEWLCPGSMAKIGYQFLQLADALRGDPRAARLTAAAVACGRWIERRVERPPNGWWPRRTTPEGAIYRRSPDGGNDPFWQTSADSLFIVLLQTALTGRGLADYREAVGRDVATYIRLGGLFGSINHDTYDPHENVAYSVAFRTLSRAADLLGNDEVRRFAYDRCLDGLEQFRMREDRNGVATRGLLYMERTWDTSYLWENAEAALAYFEAARALRSREAARSRAYELAGLVILRAAARHHYGPHGFLTEGVDWNNHVSQQHHIGGARYGAIRYTEPFLNNQHILEPTLFYLEHLAVRRAEGGGIRFFDLEGHPLWERPRKGATPPRREKRSG